MAQAPEPAAALSTPAQIAQAAACADARALCARLSPRQRDVLVLTCQGLGSAEVASHLGMSPHTVLHHREDMRHRLGVGSLIEAAVIAVRAGLV